MIIWDCEFYLNDLGEDFTLDQRLRGVRIRVFIASSDCGRERERIPKRPKPMRER